MPTLALLPSFLRVSRGIVGAPARCRGRGWLLAVAVAATTVVLYLEKWPIQAVVQRDGDGVARLLATFADACGSGQAMTLLGVLALLAGRWARRPALVDAAVAFAAAGAWCWLFTKLGQVVLAERRPNDGGAMRLFALDGHGVSGHAAAAALLYGPVHAILARGATPRVRRAVGAGWLAWTVIVAWSRVWLGMHFVWNVVLGLAIGFFTGSSAAHSLSRSG